MTQADNAGRPLAIAQLKALLAARRTIGGEIEALRSLLNRRPEALLQEDRDPMFGALGGLFLPPALP